MQGHDGRGVRAEHGGMHVVLNEPTIVAPHRYIYDWEDWWRGAYTENEVNITALNRSLPASVKRSRDPTWLNRVKRYLLIMHICLFDCSICILILLQMNILLMPRIEFPLVYLFDEYFALRFLKQSWYGYLQHKHVFLER
jgi:hypothetical protein